MSATPIRRHKHQAYEVQAPSLPASLQAEVDGLITLADEILIASVESRRRDFERDLPDLLHGRTLRVRCSSLRADWRLASAALALRLIGQRLESIAGAELLEYAIARLVPDYSPRLDARHTMLRTSWHAVGEHVG